MPKFQTFIALLLAAAALANNALAADWPTAQPIKLVAVSYTHLTLPTNREV